MNITKPSVGLWSKPNESSVLETECLYGEEVEVLNEYSNWAYPKSNCLHYVPLGAKLSIKKIENDWAEIFLPDTKDYAIGYVPSNHIVKLQSTLKDWVSVAEKLKDVPYKWGGKDSIGIDCSALLQLSYETFGQNIPRNTIDQVNLNKEKITNINKLVRGSVIFWNGHVAIMVDGLNCIHANAFHMKTIIEPLKQIIYRMGDNYQIIKMMNFNK